MEFPMTVNELIVELQALAANGHGELDVVIADHEQDLMASTDIELHEDKRRYYSYTDEYGYRPESKPCVELTP